MISINQHGLIALIFYLPLMTSAQSIVALGDLPGGAFDSRALAISPDGSVIVGASESEQGSEAFIYRDSQIQGLGFLPSSSISPRSFARAVSNNGDVVIGYSTADANTSFIYQNGIMSPLTVLPNIADYTYATTLSADASVLAGRAVTPNGIEAFVYQDQTMTTLGDLFADDVSSSYATNISNDGRYVVGYSTYDNKYEAFVYHDGVITGLGDLSGGYFASYAHDISDDGSVIVGGSSTDETYLDLGEAFVYREGQMTSLGDLPGGEVASLAISVSGDGKTIVGGAWSSEGAEATIWLENTDNEYELQTLEDALFLQGVNIADEGWTRLIEAQDIVGDLIIGYGIRNENTEAFLVELDLDLLSKQINPVPLPAAAWFFLSALISLVGFRYKK